MGQTSSVIRATTILLLVGSTCLTVTVHVAWLVQAMTSAKVNDPQTNYTYRGGDYPAQWQIPPLADVLLAHEDSVHYALATDLGIAEWNATLPSGGAIVHLGPDGRPFTVSMFHQLRCLNIIREIIVDFYLDSSPNATYKNPTLAQHCMNYLRQTVLCRGDTRLEHVRAPSGPKITVSEVTHTCKDWTAVYEQAERNHRDSQARMKGHIWNSH